MNILSLLMLLLLIGCGTDEPESKPQAQTGKVTAYCSSDSDLPKAVWIEGTSTIIDLEYILSLGYKPCPK